MFEWKIFDYSNYSTIVRLYLVCHSNTLKSLATIELMGMAHLITTALETIRTAVIAMKAYIDISYCHYTSPSYAEANPESICGIFCGCRHGYCYFFCILPPPSFFH